jgi:hypothetical protein
MSISVAQAPPAGCIDGSLPYLDLTTQSAAPRISVWAAGVAGALQFNIGATHFVVCIPKGVGESWGVFARAFDAQHPPVRLNLIPTPPSYVYPGDRIVVVAQYQTVGGTGPNSHLYNTFIEMQTVVDGAGFAFIPGLARPGPALAPPTPLTQLLMQDAVNAAFRIRVWDPGRPADMTSLEELERCLGARWGATQTDANFSIEYKRCASLGIADNYVDGGRSALWLRYRLRTEQTWTAVLWDGRRVVRPFRPGMSVLEATEVAFAQAFAYRPRKDIFVTVDPRVELRMADARPFYAPLGDEPGLGGVLLAPGDTLYVSRRQPVLLSPKRDDP